MGFFSDLKDDLSQAVNDLMPGEETEKLQDDDMMSLDQMLKNIDSIEISSDDLEDEVVDTAEAASDIELDDDEDGPVLEDLLEKMLSKDERLDEAAEEDVSEAAKEEAAVEETVVEETVAGETAAEETKTFDTEASACETEEVVEAQVEEPAEETAADETAENDWDLDNVLANALTDENVQEVEKTEENKGVETTMEISSNREALDETSVITAGMSITGDITSEGSLDLVGTVIGNIDVLGKLNITGHIQGNSKAAEIYAEGAKINGEIISDGVVKIGASTVIVGNITAISATIAGAVKGDIDVRGPVVLDASAIVMGNIKSKSVQINNGAVIEGMCSQCYADVSPTSFFEDYKMEMKKDKSK
uniref:polymer-forming cytoskeletal protein n=1 Tax=Acetatifactor sp. TaxID=1872090 RepID=UPI004056D5C1